MTDEEGRSARAVLSEPFIATTPCADASTPLPLVMTPAEAVEITGKISELVASITADSVAVVELIGQAKSGEAWRALGYASWTAYVAAEFSGALQALQAAERMPVVSVLADSGMSVRAIGEVVGVGKSTVSRDLAASGVPDGTRSRVTGRDGKSYSRRATGAPTRFTRDQCALMLPDLARAGLSSRQMTEWFGISEEQIRAVACEEGIEIPADEAIGGTRRLNGARIVRETVSTLEGLATAMELVAWDALVPTDQELVEYLERLEPALRTLNRCREQLRETTSGTIAATSNMAEPVASC